MNLVSIERKGQLASWTLLIPLIACPLSYAQEEDELTRRLDRFELLFKAMKDEISLLKSAARRNATAVVRDRRGERGFRAIYTMNRDGANVEFLAAGPGMISSGSPEWSRDGTMVAYDANPEIDQYLASKIFVCALTGPFKGENADLGYGNVPSWSPDDRRIAFFLNQGNASGARWGVWVMDADGSNRTWLCPGWYPRWSPDGKTICIEAITESPNCLYLYDVESQEHRKFLGDQWAVEYSGANWSPDGKKLVFIGRHAGKEHVAVADVMGGEADVEILHTEPNPRRRLYGPPAWSPDGSEIVFSIQKPDRPEASRRWQYTYLHSISAKEPGDPKPIEENEVGIINRGMMWSADGKKILFSSER